MKKKKEILFLAVFLCSLSAAIAILWRSDNKQFHEFHDVLNDLSVESWHDPINRNSVEQRMKTHQAIFLGRGSRLTFRYSERTIEVRTNFFLPAWQYGAANRCFFFGEPPNDRIALGLEEAQELEGKAFIFVK